MVYNTLIREKSEQLFTFKTCNPNKIATFKYITYLKSIDTAVFIVTIPLYFFDFFSFLVKKGWHEKKEVKVNGRTIIMADRKNVSLQNIHFLIPEPVNAPLYGQKKGRLSSM